MSKDDFTSAISILLQEAIQGPADAAYFLNRGDRGLLASLGALSAETASARPDGRSSVAAHVDHLRYGLQLLNRWARGENPWADANFAASWTRQRVTEAEWRALCDTLAAEARRWQEAISQPRVWDKAAMIEVMASVVHLGYHLGAIRQLAQAASGPPATD